MEGIKSKLASLAEWALEEYGSVIILLSIGIVIGYYFKFLFTDRKYYKQIDIRFREKDQKIEEYKVLVNAELAKIKVKKADANFFEKIKNFFK